MAKVKIRKKKDIPEKIEKNREQTPKQQEEEQDWVKHWEKDSDQSKPKKMGGGRRPRPFKSNQ